MAYKSTLKQIRETHFLTQKELAQILGVSRELISNIETNRARLTPELTKKINETLNTTLPIPKD